MGNKLSQNRLSEALLNPCSASCSYGGFKNERSPFGEIQYEEEVTIYIVDRKTVDWNKRPCIFACLEKPLMIFGSFVLCVVIYGLIFGIPVACIVVGVIYSDACPANPKIATFLIMLGAFACLQIFIILSSKIIREICTNDEIYLFKLFQKHLMRSEKKEQLLLKSQFIEDQPLCSKELTNDKTQSKSGNTIGAFLVIWFVPGNLWIFGIYEPNYVNDIQPDYCHPVLYLFSLYLLCISYLLIALVACCITFFLLMFMTRRLIKKCYKKVERHSTHSNEETIYSTNTGL